jgi:hypothetical protein
MNDVQRAGTGIGFKRWLTAPWASFKFAVQRMHLFYLGMYVLSNARKIEARVQEFEQKRNDYENARDKENLIYWKGFCAGIHYCLKGEWMK